MLLKVGADPQFLENTASLALVLLLLLVRLEQRGLSVLLFWMPGLAGDGVEIGSEHEEDVYERCVAKSKKQGIQRRGLH